MLAINRSLRASVAGLSLSLLTSTTALAGSYPLPTKDIVDTAVSAGSFKTLTTALNSAGLVETLKGKGPFTVFAPTDEAFAKLPAGTVESLLKPENKQKLTSILTYHVVAVERSIGHDQDPRRQGLYQRRHRRQGRHRNDQRHHPRD
jgi:uncharacterized surface protein with fasciclin (FAS1) repeats